MSADLTDLRPMPAVNMDAIVEGHQKWVADGQPITHQENDPDPSEPGR